MVNLLALMDDIVSTLDDVAVMTKMAMKKTSALMTDDLAVNADVVNGVNPDRELPLIWKIFLGSLVNKLICILGVLVLLAIYEPVLNIILLFGGIYLSYEGCHKIIEKFFKYKSKTIGRDYTEKDRIKGAIRTDLVLSVEIIVIANSSIIGGFFDKALSLLVVGILASILIYGLIAFILKVDDFGLWLIKSNFKKTGLSIVKSMPYVMKLLGFVGTLAMLLVAGGIFSHSFHLRYILPEVIQNGLIGLAGGFIFYPIIEYGKKKLLR